MRRHRILIALTVLASLALPASALGASDKEILLARPLAPTNVNVFTQAIYPSATPSSPAPGPDLTEQQAGSMLDAYLVDEFPGDSAKRAAAKAVFNSSNAKSKISSPSLRAGLAALKGTFAERAVTRILNDQDGGQPLVKEVRFDASVPASNIAETRLENATGRYLIWFSSDYRGQSPFLFSQYLAHEALHISPPDRDCAPNQTSCFNGSYEEATAISFDTLFRLHQLARHPGLATLGSDFARRINSSALTRLNSGRGSTLGLFATNANALLLPGSSKPWRSFWDRFSPPSSNTTPGNPVLASYLAKIHAAGAPTCSAATFNQALLNCIDKQGNAGLSSAELVKASKAMKLDTNVERHRSLSISYGHSNFTGKLSSQQKPCTRSQSIAVYRQKSGPDQKVGTDKTNSSGAYSVHKSSAKGTFYVKAPRSTVAGTGVCLDAKSRGKRVG